MKLCHLKLLFSLAAIFTFCRGNAAVTVQLGGNIGYLGDQFIYSKQAAAQSQLTFKYPWSNGINMGAQVNLSGASGFGSIIKLDYQHNHVRLRLPGYPKNEWWFLPYEAAVLEISAYYKFKLPHAAIAPAIGIIAAYNVNYGTGSDITNGIINNGNLPQLNDDKANNWLPGFSVGCYFFPVKSIAKKVDYFFSLSYMFYPKFPVSAEHFENDGYYGRPGRQYYFQGSYATLQLALYLAFTFPKKKKQAVN